MAEGKSWENELSKILMSYRSSCHPMTGKSPAVMLLQREIRTKLPSFSLEAECALEGVKTQVKAYQKRMKAYHDQRNKVQSHKFKIGDVVYCAENVAHGKLSSNFRPERYVVIKFTARDTCSVVNILNGKIYRRNVKHIRHANVGRKLIINEDEEVEQPSGSRSSDQSHDTNTITENDNEQTVIRTRSGRVSKSTRVKDFVYY